MFGIDGPEFLVILLVLIVVVGPKDLPKMFRTIGRITAQMRGTAQEFRRQFDEAMRESEINDIQKSLGEANSQVKTFDPRKNLAELLEPLREAARDVRTEFDAQILMPDQKVKEDQENSSVDTSPITDEHTGSVNKKDVEVSHAPNKAKKGTLSK